jgi:glycosidase
VRSFYDSDGDGIGDLRGVELKLDYIQSLGVDVLWLTPIYPSPSIHGYDVTDFFGVNPEYGTLADLQSLVAAAHARGLRVVLDFVPSHLSVQHPFFANAYGNPSSEYTDWFVFTDDGNKLYAGFANNTEMPRFNHYNPEVVAYLLESALFWLDLDDDRDYTDGVDGFRVDNATFPPQDFLISLRQAVKAANPDALLLGEAWVTDPRNLSIYYQDQFDALFDFPLYSTLQGGPNSPGDGVLNGKGFASLLGSLFKEQAERYPAEGLRVRFLSNHDTDRIASEVWRDPARQRLAASLLACLPGPAMLYYGEEIGMPGQKGTAPWWDAYRRAPLDWHAAEVGPGQPAWFTQPDRGNQPFDGISVEEQDGDPASLLTWYRALFALRNNSPAMLSSDVAFPPADGLGKTGLVFLRGTGVTAVLCAYNFGEEPLDVSISNLPFSAGSLRDLLTGTPLPTGFDPATPYSISLPAVSALWLLGE